MPEYEQTLIDEVVLPDPGPPLRANEGEQETYYVLDGEFEFVCGADRVSGGPGTLVRVPRAVRYKNIGTTAGRVLFGFTTAGIDRFFNDLAAEKNLTQQTMSDIAERHGITIL